MLKSERITDAIMSNVRSGLKSIISELFGQMADGDELCSESLEKGIWDACRQLSREVLEHTYAAFHADYKGTAIECECGRRMATPMCKIASVECILSSHLPYR